MRDLFYTEEQRERLKTIATDSAARHKPMSEATGALILDALGEQQNTLQIIAAALEETGANDCRENNLRVKRGEVYYADLDGCIGSEQEGRRLVAIMQNDTGNTYSPTVIVVPAASQAKTVLSTHVPICGEEELDSKTFLMAEQIQTIDKIRLRKFICALKEETIKKIESAIKAGLGMESE